jgi:Cadherin-like domain/FG-GAP repeat/Putative Ig domain/Domain of unknown function (DUF4214)
LLPKRWRSLVSLRLEELERRTTPSVTVVPQQFATTEYTALNIAQSQMLAGDSNSGGAALTVSNPTQPANATLLDNHNGTFTFTPNDAFSGSTTFQYTVGAGLSQLTAADGAEGDHFGVSVSIDGDTAVIGADQGDNGAGAAYVFVLSGTTWVQQAELTAADGFGFGTSVSISGDTAVIGAPDEIVNSNSVQGAAYVFVRSGSTWSQQAELAAGGAATGNNGSFGSFGASVAINGDTAVVGADGVEVNNQFPQGAAYVFVRSGSTWSQQAELTAADGTTLAEFGSSVAIDGDTAVVSANASSSDPQGAVYVFVRSGGTWNQQAELTPASGVSLFYSPVAISGDTIVFGAASANSYAGAAYVFVRAGTTWSQQAELTAAGEVAGDSFGGSVAIDGDTAVVEADSQPSPAVYIFMRFGTTWSQQNVIASSTIDSSGPLAITGNTVFIGAPYQNVANQIAGPGAAFVQDLSTATATATVQVNPATAQLFVAPASLSTGMEGQVYPNTTFTATGGAGSDYTFQESGALPPGLTFDSATGQLTGTPTQIGIYPGIIIVASDGQGGSGSQTYTLIVSHYGVNGFPVPYPETIYAPPTSTSDPKAALDASISGLYNSILDRNPEAGATSLPFWENVFNQVQTGAQANPLNLPVPANTDAYQYVADGIWDSLEHRRNEVETYYQDFLGRTLDLSNAFDAQGLTYWTNQFKNGATEEQVIRGFLSSAEYLYDHRNDASLADALNTSLLGGSATAPDLQIWKSDLSPLDAQRASIQDQTFASPVEYQAQLSAANLALLGNDTATTGVLVDMLSSSEYQQAALNSFYQAFLRRAGTPTEEQTLLGLRDGNGNPLSLGAIAEMMLASPEYRTNAINSEM